MITAITIRNFKAIKEVVDLPLDRFHVLVGPNGSGKSTFLEAIDFVRACLEFGPRKALEYLNIPDFDDLTYMRQGGMIVIGLWLDLEANLPRSKDKLINYRLVIKKDEALGVSVHEELLRRYPPKNNALFLKGGSDFIKKAKPERLLGKTKKNTDFYQRESRNRQDSFAIGMDKLALAHLLPDTNNYPTANAVKNFLLEGIRYIQLDSRAMRQPCAATKGMALELDGSNLARAVGSFERIRQANSRADKRAKKSDIRIKRPGLKDLDVEDPGRDQMEEWIAHLRYALPELEKISWGQRAADNANYIVLEYQNGLKCPSWLASDGTLRMLALTILAFLPESPAIYMVEEPENGVHPKALEIILGALQSIPSGQVLVATHSPLVVQEVGREPLLCFSKAKEGVKIIRGEEHPAFQDWDGTPDLATVFATGVLE